ncbi:Uncharacterised protein [Mycobacterium tuberculosis]|uniref:Uncharacterized protein n=1 Tax=Mycobacterium tuberculosis TaxID=1773 RepID=A0A655IWW7_MYCTX|nr:Uncharacterised protein [Mycobacterium tuberculosis]CKR51478.1 Uncharacterised protein [Mycobacterium tuberculosis]CKS57089.1 Uncharacterised protein [Mycobacterium tuberculosis]CKT60637.1 Uncharacterised protein [Mycobacterium tuberculosis]COW19519.1 Uncharacterised protein [Mycobacterium tuberculosis]
MLIEHCQPDGLAALDTSDTGLDGAGDQAQQGRLAGAVSPDDADTFTRADPPFDVAQHRAAPRRLVRDRHAEQVDDVLSEPSGRQLGQLHGVARWRHVCDQLVGGLDPELGLAGPRRCAAAQPSQLLAQQVLPLGFGRGGQPVPLDALQHVRRVAAFERFDDSVVHFPCCGGDLVEEPAVVGDHE